MGFDRGPGGGQTNPGSAVVPVAGGVAAVEAFDDMAHLVTGQSFPSISDVDEYGAGALLTGTDGDLPAGRGVAQGVGQQVAHDLAEALAVHQYGNRRGDRNDLQAHPFGREGFLGRGGGGVNKLAEGLFGTIQVNPVLLGAGDVVDVFDQPGQTASAISPPPIYLGPTQSRPGNIPV